MFHPPTVRRKALAILAISATMAGLLYAYEINAAAIERGVHAIANAFSPLRALEVSALRKELAAGGPISPAPADEIAEGMPVLLYHGIVKKADRFSMRREAFKDQMFALKRAGWRTVTIEEFEAFLRGERALPPRSFLLTFDDGRTDSYEAADPILEVLDYTAVMFVATGASMPSEDVRWSYYVSPNDIAAMLESGRWEIGSHAVQRGGGRVAVDAARNESEFLSSRAWIPDLGRLETTEEYAARVDRELGESRRELERAFGVDVRHFSYPFGDYGQRTVNEERAVATIDASIRSHYGYAYRQVWPKDGEYALNYPGDPVHRLKRVEVPTDWSGAALVASLDGLRDKPLPWRGDPAPSAGWHVTWGTVAGRADGLALEATGETTGAAAFLDGTSAWRTYRFSADFEPREGSHVSLMAGYRDARNYRVCTFGDGYVKIEDIVDGEPFTLATATSTAEVRSADILVGEETVSCLADGLPVLSATATPAGGGVGVRVWDPRPGQAGLLLRRTVVTPLETL